MNRFGLPPLGLMRAGASVVVLAALGLASAGAALRGLQDNQRVASVRAMQQWGLALSLHLRDHGNLLPETGQTPLDGPQPSAWFDALPPYLSEPPLTARPPGSRPRPGVPSLWIRAGSKPVKAWDPEAFCFQVAMNRALQPDPAPRSFRADELGFAGSVVFLAPVDGFVPVADPDSVVFDADADASAAFLFCDGHVARVSRSAALDPASLPPPASRQDISWFRP